MRRRFKFVLLGFALLLVASFWCWFGMTPSRREQMSTLKSQAQEIFDASSDEDYEKWANLTWPAAIEQSGGREKWTQAMKKLAGLKKQSKTKQSIKVGDPKSLVTGSENHYGIVPYDIELTSDGSRTVMHQFLVGVSTDGGRTWKFIEGTRTRFRLKQFFPDFPDDIELPKE